MKETKLENVVGALALAIADEVLHGAHEQAPEPGPAAAALTMIGHVPSLTIERLRRALRLSHPGAVRLIDRLVSEGLVVRLQSAEDRRAVALHLTEAGEIACEAILSGRQKRIARALQVLSREERESFGKIAEKFLSSFVQDLDQAYSVCRLCDPKTCESCPVDLALQCRKSKS
jgi:DNA-binding MarR family transcriptional regulator